MSEYFEKEDYTIGWICALPVELAAAKAFLDHQHSSLPQDENDGNLYVFGRIGHQNVVIACLPSGNYGEASAATVVNDMHRSFPSIRIGLVVGIGGGVPQLQHDIRLGDVVVSEPGPGHSGVWPYDVGKTVQAGRFVHTGTSNKPPRSLLTALAELKSEQLRTNLNPITDIVKSALSNGFASERFVRPPDESDILFCADYDHPDEQLSCNECDISRIETRQPRSHNRPYIHYGLIASGNQVMKHGLTRSRLTQEKEVLCFEMEAAAVMDVIPSIVIRGICDYSDSHKNKEWQPYAALVAAAFASRLLKVLPESEDKARYNRDRQQRSKIDLPIADGAAFGSFIDEHEPECLKGTRVELLDQIGHWVDDPLGKPIFWLVGMAGTGKSTISRTVARSLRNRGKLGASFFFKRSEIERSSGVLLFTTIATQLADHFPRISSSILQATKADAFLPRKALREQFEKLVLQPLLTLEPRSPPTKVVLIIDALDECERKDDVRLIIHLLSRFKDIKPVLDVRVFITSRPNLPIRPTFQRLPKDIYDDVLLHNVPKIEHDISLYLKHELMRIVEEHYLSSDWPGDQRFQKLVDLANPLFIYAATLCRFIGDDLWPPDSRLEIVLSERTEWNASQLDKIYLPILEQLLISQTAKERDILIKEFRQIVGSIINLAIPLSVSALANLLSVKEELVECRLKPLHAVLNVPDLSAPDRRHLPVRTLHLSFRDFLVDPSSQGRFAFWVDEKETHRMIADRCLQLMSGPTGLKRDICNLRSPGILRSEIDSERVENLMPLELQYACRYWVYHIHRSGDTLSDNSRTHLFLQQYLLHWLEAASLLRDLPNIFNSLETIISIIDNQDGKILLDFVHDIQRFVRQNHHLIATAPLQTYVSAIIFAPANSIVRRIFNPQIISPSITLLPRVQGNWNAHLQTLEGHTGQVKTVIFSPDGKILASAADDNTVRLWDASSGAPLQTLEEYANWVGVIAFSPDGKLLASAAYDNRVKLCNVPSGILLNTIEGHENSSITAIAFSPNGKTLASASYNETIILWNAVSNLLIQTLKGSNESIIAIAFSPDSKILASTSADKTIKLWDTKSGILIQSLEGHKSSIHSIMFSTNNKILASASEDNTVRLWDTGLGVSKQTLVQTLDTLRSSISAIAFSPDNEILAVAVNDTVRLWNAFSGAPLCTLRSEGWVEALAFSPNGKTLVSADQMVKLWDVASETLIQSLKGHEDPISAVVFSPDGKTLVSASADQTINLWDVALEPSIQILEGHTTSISALVFSPDGKTLASTSHDDTTKLWDIASGAVLWTLGEHRHTDRVKVMVFSPDSKTLALASYDATAMLWDTGSRSLIRTLKGHTDTVWALAFSPDCKILASGSGDRTVRLWEAVSGVPLWTGQHAFFVHAVTFSPDGTTLASASKDRSVLWDIASGTTLHTLEHPSWVEAVEFSPDGKILASASDDQTIKLWNTGSGAIVHIFKEHKETVNAVAFSPGGKILASASYDKTVKLWDATSGALLQSFDLECSSDALSFSHDGRYLYCDQQAFLLSPNSPGLDPTLIPHIHIEGEWISLAGKKLVWLPHNRRRSYRSAFNNNLIVIGHASGEISFIELTDEVDSLPRF